LFTNTLLFVMLKMTGSFKRLIFSFILFNKAKWKKSLSLLMIYLIFFLFTVLNLINGMWCQLRVNFNREKLLNRQFQCLTGSFLLKLNIWTSWMILNLLTTSAFK
jgi:hypothetical protein